MKTLLETAKEAISAVHSDSTVALEQTLERLEELRDEIDMLIEAIEWDIEQATS